jgi:hypothetical protein
MPMQVKYYLLTALLMSGHALAVDEDRPSLDFIEYLGELETEIDGELISPNEFELVVDGSMGEENDHE